ncbi:MAG: CRISPR-associated endonuclease Cas1 [Nitrososphaerota archaeon]
MSELVVDGYGAFLGMRKGSFYLKSSDGKRTEIPPPRIDHISIRNRAVSISAEALITAARYGIEITLYWRGRPTSRVTHAAKGGGAVTRQAQLEAVKSPKGLEAAKAFVTGKLHNQRMVIYQRSKDAVARGLSSGHALETCAEAIRKTIGLLTEVSTVDQVRAYEAQGAQHYWRAFGLLLPSELGFMGRVVWSPTDPFNKALNISYGILRARTWGAVMSANLDPYIGYLHLPHGRHMCLVSDLMEEFRPAVVDRPLLTLAINKLEEMIKVKEEDDRPIVKAVIQSLQASDRRLEKCIYEQARRLASFLRGTATSYEPFKLRW